MKAWVEKARRPEMIGGLGGFAGLFDASALTKYAHPLLATSTDGVGTKVAIAQQMDVHDTIGFDLVGMVVDDLVVCGAEPLFMTDYIACGRVVPERIAAIVKGIAEACVVAGCALIGGETAEHPGLLDPDEYDVAGATTGVVEADRLLGPGRVRPGDVVHRDGGQRPALQRLLPGPPRAPAASAGWALDRDVDVLGRTLGEELLEPTRIYAKACLDLADRTGDARDVPRDRRRAGRQPRAGPARGARRHHRPGHLDAATGLRRSSPRWARCRRPTSRPRSTAASAWWRSPPPDDVDAAIGVLATHGIQAWVAGEVRTDADKAAGSPWWASTPAGERGLSKVTRNAGIWCAGTARDRVALPPRYLTDQPGRLVVITDSPGRVCEGVDPMGRGRAKAKQTKVARDLKYRTHETDFGALGQ